MGSSSENAERLSKDELSARGGLLRVRRSLLRPLEAGPSFAGEPPESDDDA